MWKLYQTSKTTASRPSELMCIEDRLAAYQFDSAVVLFGGIVENAVQEMHNAGSEREPKWKPKYTMLQLLDAKFRLPSPPTEREREQAATAQWQGLARTIDTNPMLANGTK